MSVRLSTAAVVIAASVLVTRPAVAQPAPTSSSEVRVLAAVGTREEQPQMQAMIGRVKTRLSTDAALVKRYDNAIAKRDFLTVKAVFAEAAGVKPEQVIPGVQPKVGLDHTTQPLFHLASMPAYYPFYFIVAFKSGAVCVGFFDSGKDECVGALKKAGYTPVT